VANSFLLNGCCPTADVDRVRRIAAVMNNVTHADGKFRHEGMGQFEDSDVHTSIEGGDVHTPKAFANASPGLLQPWGLAETKIMNAESVRFARNSFRVQAIGTWIFPRVEATLGWN
jgi:hypothetical protein